MTLDALKINKISFCTLHHGEISIILRMHCNEMPRQLLQNSGRRERREIRELIAHHCIAGLMSPLPNSELVHQAGKTRAMCNHTSCLLCGYLPGKNAKFCLELPTSKLQIRAENLMYQTPGYIQNLSYNSQRSK